jgi:hypothetical protein
VAYVVEDAELSALINPLERTVKMVTIPESAPIPERWTGGTLQPLVSKRDLPRKSRNTDAIIIDDNLRDADAMLVPRAKPQPAIGSIKTVYSLNSLGDDPTLRRGEQMSDRELIASRTASRVLLTSEINKNGKRNASSVRRCYYVVTCALQPDWELVKRLGI